MEFGVTERTIRRDIEILCIKYPIYTKRGRTDGGVYIIDSFSFEKIYMTDEKVKLFENALSVLEKYELVSDYELENMRNTLAEYSSKQRKNAKKTDVNKK